MCIPEEGTACANDSGCPEGAQWCVGNVCVDCDNSGEVWDLACEEGTSMVSRNGCTPCACYPDNECVADDECGDGVCQAGETCMEGCRVGDTSCCYGNVCLTDGTGCGDAPETGCFEHEECGDGEACVPRETFECVPSTCTCDEATGTWGCSGDCAPGSCEPADACTTDADCPEGEEWCELGVCVPCSNDAFLCDIFCEEGTGLPVRNERNLEAETDTVIGASTYTEQGWFQLAELGTL